MPPVRPVRSSVASLALTLWQVSSPVGAVRWYHQAAVVPEMVSVAVVSVTALAASDTAEVVKSTSAILLAEAQPLAL